MSNKKEDLTLSVPPSVGKVLGTLAGGAVGFQAGYKIASSFIENNKQESSSDESIQQQGVQDETPEESRYLYNDAVAAPDLDIMSGIATGVLGAIAGANLGNSNPNKSALIALGAVGSAFAFNELKDNFNEVHSKIDNFNNDNLADNSFIDGTENIDIS